MAEEIRMAEFRRTPIMPGLTRSSLFLSAVLVLVISTDFSSARAAEKLKLLIIDGQNNHTWQAMTPPMKAELEKTGRFTVDVATTPPANSAKEEWAKFRP